MKKSLLFCIAFLSLLFLPETIQAQVAQPDTSFIQQAVSEAMQVYKKASGLQTHLYNGPEYYVQLKPYIEGHQFFKDKSLEKGAVHYDGMWFHDVSMLYDVVLDEVVSFHPGNGVSQMLVKEKIDTFRLKGHTLVRLEIDSTLGAAMRAGFYDLLYNGKIKAFVKREKTLQERVTTRGLEGQYAVEDKYYLFKDDIYYPVRTKSSVIKVLEDEKKQLQKFSRVNKLKFRKKREEAIVKMAQHYDSLKNE